jgi:integrase
VPRVHLSQRKGVYYASVDGAPRQSTGLRDKQAAEAYRKRLERELADPAHAAARAHRLGVALDDLIAEKKRNGAAEPTLKVDRMRAGHFERILGNVPLSEVDARAVARYTDQRLSEVIKPAKKNPPKPPPEPGKRRHGPLPKPKPVKPVRTVSRHTIGKERSLLRAALALAKRLGLFAGNPADIVPEWDSAYTPRETFLTREQAETLLEHLTPERAAHVAWLFGTGGRWSESLKAERADHAIGPKLIRFRGTKTAGADAITPIPPQTIDLVERALRDAPNKTGAGPLFAKWGKDNARRDIAAACRNAGVPVVTPNDMRRSLATWLAWAGVPLDVARVVFRHTTTRMLEKVYAKWTPQAAGRLLALAGPIPATPPECTPGALGQGLEASVTPSIQRSPQPD